MSGIFGGAAPALPREDPIPTREDPAIEEARRKEVIAQRKSRGAAGNLLTGGTGITAPANTNLKTAMGA